MIYLLFLYILAIEARLMKRAWMSSTSDIGALNDPSSNFQNIVQWEVSRWTLGTIDANGLPDDMEHVIVLAIPYENGVITNNAPQLRIEIVAETDVYDSATDTWTGSQEIAIRSRSQTTIPPTDSKGNVYNQFGETSTFEDKAYNIVDRVYTMSNSEYGIDAPFPPTEETNEATNTVETYRSRTNDCQTGAIKIINAINP